MDELEELTRRATVKGIQPDRLGTIMDVRYGSAVAEATYKYAFGRPSYELEPLKEERI